MVINGIEYYVGLYIMREDDFPEYEDHFEDFYALNSFVRRNSNNPKFLDSQVCYSLVEAIDGVPDAFSWVKNINWCEFTDEQIQEEIDGFVEFEKNNKEYWEKVDAYSKEIHYSPAADDYIKKQTHLKDISYVCPSCIRRVEDCRCRNYPFYLVQIDTKMVPIIRMLNQKGYRTTDCCAGHPEEKDFLNSGIYIGFAEEYNFDEPL